MIVWNNKLYTYGKAAKKQKKLMRSISNGKPTRDIYCICYASNEQNLFDIIPANELLFSYYKEQEIHILGLASGREKAIMLVKDMLCEIYKETGGFAVSEYFGRNA